MTDTSIDPVALAREWLDLADTCSDSSYFKFSSADLTHVGTARALCRALIEKHGALAAFNSHDYDWKEGDSAKDSHRLPVRIGDLRRARAAHGGGNG